MLILYAYYKIWFNFDINTLHKDAKKDAKIISEHSNSSTIFKSGVLKSGVGAAISMARLDLYQHSYFMNLYENAYENYVEKIAEIESYKANKHLRDSSTTNDSEAAAEAEAAEVAKAKAEAELKNKNKEFEEKVDNVNIAKSERRKVEKKLLDFDSENDRTLKDTNMELYKDKLAKRIDKSNLNDEEINKIKKRQKDILDTKKDLRQQVSKLKTSENEARRAIKPPLINTNNIEGLMNSGVDKAKGMFDNIKIDPRALLKPKA
jgi:membrane-associated HD superfamily phosphohydrolase